MGVDPELFFPTGSGESVQRQEQAAKAVCGGCPVLTECLTWATSTRQDDGICGGCTAGERSLLYRLGADGLVPRRDDLIECKGCELLLPPARFGRDQKRANGRKSRCSKCVYRRERASREKREETQARRESHLVG